MKDYIEERAIEAANYIIDTRATVRQTADKMGISKSTVHKDITERLVLIRPMLAAQARVVLDANKAERHIRRGRSICMSQSFNIAYVVFFSDLG